MKKLRVCLSLLLAFVLGVSSCFLVYAEETGYNPITEEDALHTEGEYLVNAAGDRVFLRGINLGGWLIQEDWFVPTDNGEQGDYYTLETLISRFGTEKAYELYDIYQDAWIQETDFRNIADMGFNCVRIPFWYRNFQSDDNGTWILDENGNKDLSRLEWAVDMCRKYGLYAIPDLHGANGCQGMQDHCGRKGENGEYYHFFDQDEQGREYRRQAVELWEVIAERFAGDPAVAMFDLLNEPMCNVPIADRIYSRINDFYDDAYHAIRAVDPNRMITMIGTWDIGKLPKPKSRGWTNVVYQFHQYDQYMINYTGRVDRAYLCNYNVPLFAGEFHPTGEDLKLRDVIEVYDTRNVMWALWTYKGYNSWAAWADWFLYGSTSDEMIVHPETDSYEEIARKWGSMETNGGLFYKGTLYDVAYEFLSETAVSPSVPFNSETIPNPTTAPSTEPETPPVPSSTDSEKPETLVFNNQQIQIEDDFLLLSGDPISPTALSKAANMEVTIETAQSGRTTVATGDTLICGNDTYIIVQKRDVNSDGKINTTDARSALRYAVHLIDLSEACQKAADFNDSGKVNSSDARGILRYSVGLR